MCCENENGNIHYLNWNKSWFINVMEKHSCHQWACHQSTLSGIAVAGTTSIVEEASESRQNIIHLGIRARC
jgi:hypothetical protein